MKVLLFTLLCSLTYTKFLKASTNSKITTLTSRINEFKKAKFTAPSSGLFGELEKKVDLVVLYNQASRSFSIELLADSNKDSPKVVAIGKYRSKRYEKGWDYLYLETNSTHGLFLQHYAAGLLEGYLTHQAIADYNNNLKYYWKDSKVLKEMYNLLEQIDNNLSDAFEPATFMALDSFEFTKKVSDYTNFVRIHGVSDGFKAISSDKSMGLVDIYFNNSEGNTDDYQSLIKIRKGKVEGDFDSDENLKKFYGTTDKSKIHQKLRKHYHCSGIAKLVRNKDGKHDILTGHETWQDYNEMVRTAKIVNFQNEGTNPILGMKPYTVNYSSYPGVLFSGDDFYITGNKIASVQTSLSQANKKEYSKIDINKYIPEFMRLWTVTTLSESAADWVKLYSSYPNHMYVTEWIVVDYNKLEEMNQGHKVDSGLIYMLDEIISDIKHKDMTEAFLKDGYLGSFNIPYFDSILKESGEPKIMPGVSYHSKKFNARYYIMKEIVGEANTPEEFRHVLEYNSYKQKNNLKFDPSVTNPNDGIAGRSDLMTFDGKTGVNGGTDFKITNNELINDLKALYKQGPTTDRNPNLTPVIMNNLTSLKGFVKGIPNIQKFDPFYFDESLFTD